MPDPFNQVAQGREGTGAAFILSGNRAADIFHQQVSEDEKERRMLEFQRQKDLREQQAVIEDNLSKVALKDHWIRHDEELRGQHSDLMNYAGEIKMQGGNPWNIPEWRDKKNEMDALAVYSGQLSSQFDAFQKEISANRDKYSEESINKVAAYYNPSKSLRQYQAEGMKPPTLEPRYSMGEMLKGVKGKSMEYEKNGRVITAADRSKNVQLAEGLQDTPSFQHFVKELGGDPTAGAYPVKQNGKTIYSTRDEVLAPMAKKVVAGMHPSEYEGMTKEQAEGEILAFMKKQNAAFGTVVSRVADHLDAGIDGKNRTDWNATGTPLQWARLALDTNKEHRVAAKTAKAQANEEYLTQLKAGARAGDNDSMGRLNAYLAPYDGQARHTPEGLVIDLPVKDKKNNLTASLMAAVIGGKEVGLETLKKQDGLTWIRYKIGKGSGAEGDIQLDNVLKEIDLLKKYYTPKNYSGELDDMGEGTSSGSGELDNLGVND